jgi:hypothetical protein
MFKPSLIYIRTGNKVSKVYTIGKGLKIFGCFVIGWMVLANVAYFGEIYLNRYIYDTNENTGNILDKVDYYDTRQQELNQLLQTTTFIEVAVTSLSDCKKPIEGVLKGCNYE